MEVRMTPQEVVAKFPSTPITKESPKQPTVAAPEIDPTGMPPVEALTKGIPSTPEQPTPIIRRLKTAQG